MLSLILFDIDGTLIRAGTEVHRSAFAYAFRSVYGLDLTLDGIHAAGRTDTWLFYEALRSAGVPDGLIAERMVRAFDEMCTYVDQHLGDLQKNVLPGVPEVLQTFHEAGALLALLTGNLSAIAHAKMRRAGLDAYFDTGGFGEESATRSDLVPVALAKAADKAGTAIPPRHAVILGDTPLDIEAGRAHGVRTCGVATGPFTESDLRAAGADLVLPSLEESAMAVEAILHLLR